MRFTVYADINKKYHVEFGQVYGIDRMMLYDESSSFVPIAMFRLDDVKLAIEEFENGGGK